MFTHPNHATAAMLKNLGASPPVHGGRLWCREAALQRQQGACQGSIERIADGFPIVAQGRHEPGSAGGFRWFPKVVLGYPCRYGSLITYDP